MQVKINGQMQPGDLLLETAARLIDTHNILPLSTLVKTDRHEYYIPICNRNPYPVSVPKGTVIGTVSQVEEVDMQSTQFPQSEVSLVNLMTWTTPEEHKKHWDTVRAQLKFGDQTESTVHIREKLMKLLEQYHDCFACSMEELGEALDTEFDFEITEKPHKQPPRRVPYALKEEIYKSLERDIAAGILVHSDGSEFSSPIVPVRKKTSDIRIASDFRLINAKTKLSAAPLPRIDDIFDAIGAIKPKFFLALDMASGYHQIKMSKKAQKMSAIVCGPYHLEWTRMPYGLSNSPSFFMTYMNKTLTGIDQERIFVFIDDIIITAENPRETNRNFRKSTQTATRKATSIETK